MWFKYMIGRFIGWVRGWNDGIRASIRVSKSDVIDLSDIFMVFGGTALPTGILFAKKMLRDETGNRLLTSPTAITQTSLTNIEYLSNLPKDTLGRQYYDALTGKNQMYYNVDIESPDCDVREVKDFGHQDRRKWTKPPTDDDQLIAMRLMGEIRWNHDLLHILLDYKPDLSGEIGLNAFTVSHIGLPGPKLQMLTWMIFRSWKTKSWYDFRVALEGLINGFRAHKSIFIVDWDKYLDQPISQVRTSFGIRLPKYYKPSELFNG